MPLLQTLGTWRQGQPPSPTDPSRQPWPEPPSPPQHHIPACCVESSRNSFVPAISYMEPRVCTSWSPGSLESPTWGTAHPHRPPARGFSPSSSHLWVVHCFDPWTMKPSPAPPQPTEYLNSVLAVLPGHLVPLSYCPQEPFSTCRPHRVLFQDGAWASEPVAGPGPPSTCGLVSPIPHLQPGSPTVGSQKDAALPHLWAFCMDSPSPGPASHL